MQKKTIQFADMLMSEWGAPMPKKGSPLTPKAQFEQWIKNLDKDTSYYDADELERTYTLLRRSHDRAGLPTTPDILKALKQARKEIDNEKPQLKLSETPRPQTDEDILAAALDIMRGQKIVLEACEKGWIGPLFDFVLKNRHLPSGAQIEIVKEEARETIRWIKRQEENYVEVFKEKPAKRSAVPSWQAFGDPHEAAERGLKVVATIQTRKDKLIDYFLHGVECKMSGLLLR